MACALFGGETDGPAILYPKIRWKVGVEDTWHLSPCLPPPQHTHEESWKEKGDWAGGGDYHGHLSEISNMLVDFLEAGHGGIRHL